VERRQVELKRPGQQRQCYLVNVNKSQSLHELSIALRCMHVDEFSE
jgi:hypothetical protein